MNSKSYPRPEDIDLVALDLDGTVICPKGIAPVSSRTKAAVRALQEQGIRVTFVTGRTEDYAMELAREFQLTDPMVTYNGARLFSPSESRVLFEATIDSEVASTLADWLSLENDVVACYVTRQSGLHLLQNRCSGDPDYDDHLFGTPRLLVGSLSQGIKEGGTVSKLIVLTTRSLEQAVADRVGDAVQVVRTHPDLAEILPPGVSKGHGVSRLCELLGIDLKRVLAIGDQENDISTFKLCGYSVAMGEAPEKVKQAADFGTGTFTEDGCAQALENILSRRRS